MTETQMVTIRLAVELHERLRRLAFERRTSINAIVTAYVIAGLDKDAGGDEDQ
jgi:predicted transcriptional regulator